VKRIAINYVENDGAAQEAAQLVQERGAETLLLKANVGDVGQLKAMFARVKETWDSLDIYVSNARASLATGSMRSDGDHPGTVRATVDTQATEFLVACREAVPMMGRTDGSSRSPTPRKRDGQLAAMGGDGSAKAAKESLVRYFAVALAQRGITVNSISPGLARTACSPAFRRRSSSSSRTGTRAGGRRCAVSARRGHRQRCRPDVHRAGRLHHGPNPACRRGGSAMLPSSRWDPRHQVGRSSLTDQPGLLDRSRHRAHRTARISVQLSPGSALSSDAPISVQQATNCQVLHLDLARST